MTCFRRKGVVATSLSDICEEANSSMGALYKFFKSRDDLLEEVLNVLLGRRDELLKGESWSALRKGLVAYRRELAGNLFWLEFEGVIQWSPQLSSARARHGVRILAYLEGQLAKFAAAGEIVPSFNVKQTANLISVIFDGTLIPTRNFDALNVSYKDFADYLDFAVGYRATPDSLLT